MPGPVLPDIDLIQQARIKNPCKVKIDSTKDLKKEVKRFLRVLDEQTATNRFIWHNLPCDLSSQDLERLLYYKGNLAFFYYEPLNQFFFMPYALDGSLDFYGRFKTIHPVPVHDDASEAQKKLLETIKLNCSYAIKNQDDLVEDDLYHTAVLLSDYLPQASQMIISRQVVNDQLLETMAECVPFMRTSLLAGTGVKGVRVQDSDQQASVLDGSISLKKAALAGDPLVPIVGSLEFQELTDHGVNKGNDYMMAMQSLDNLRLSGYGIDAGGLFEKKAHMLKGEAEMNGSSVGLVLTSDLAIRQNFCNIVNSIWGIGIWCEPNENLVKTDLNGDGKLYNDITENESGIESPKQQKGGNSDASNV